jgi:bacillithiol biosynthesis cysteine-adding enzyme BshC
MPIFDKTEIFLRQTRAFDPLILDYLENDQKTKEFIQFSADESGLLESLNQRADAKVDRALLVRILTAQYSAILKGDESSVIPEQISLLEDPEVYTICTGHQLNLFTGPLYTVFKIITTIRTARHLTAISGKKVVPLFWMASEDHDIEEINHINIYGQRYKWEVEWSGPAGKLACKGMQEVINTLKQKFEREEGSAKWFDILEACYKEEYTLSEATRRFLHVLFGKYGLIILDADNAELKKSFLTHFLQDVDENLAFAEVTKTIKSINVNYKEQIHPRPVNLFYIKDNRRVRIDKDLENFKLSDETQIWTKDELLDEIQSKPERFSPNVVLRPLYQEKILPNVATVGGPAEISYWLELKSLFNASGIPFPVLLLRNSAVFLTVQQVERLKKFSIETGNIFNSQDDWIRNYLKHLPSEEFGTDEAKSAIDKEFGKLSDLAGTIEPALKSQIEVERKKLTNTLQTIEDKAIRALKRKNETSVNQLRKLHESIFPSGKLQERTENILPWLFRYDTQFIDEALQHLEPLGKTLSIFMEKSGKVSVPTSGIEGIQEK